MNPLIAAFIVGDRDEIVAGVAAHKKRTADDRHIDGGTATSLKAFEPWAERAHPSLHDGSPSSTGDWPRTLEM
jgi:hypothetical protein